MGEGARLYGDGIVTKEKAQWGSVELVECGLNALETQIREQCLGDEPRGIGRKRTRDVLMRVRMRKRGVGSALDEARAEVKCSMGWKDAWLIGQSFFCAWKKIYS